MTPIELPLPPRELNPNWSGNKFKKNRIAQKHKADCTVLARAHEWMHGKTCLPGGKIPLHIQWFPATLHSYDEDNADASLKWAKDALATVWEVNDTRFTVARFECMPKVKGGKVLISILEQEGCFI
jgi:hypothetical protein